MNKPQRIDWEQVRGRLLAQTTTTEGSERISPEEIAAIHLRRAAALRRRTAGAVTNDGWPALVFEISQERYCLPLADLTEVFPQAKLTSVPGGPAELHGLASAHGEICSVINLPQLLGISTERESEPAYVVVLRHPTLLLGLWVDVLSGIEFISPSALKTIDGLAPGMAVNMKRTAQRTIVLECETLLARILA